MLPRVTVLMTIYNGEKYLRECMDSVLNQTFKDFEFLIIDDCSTDSSRDIIKSYRDGRICLIENGRNIGQVRSLNIGLDHAGGEYIARMDQDDVAMRNKLERQLVFMEKSPDISVTGTWGEAVDESGIIREKNRLPIKNEEIIGNIFFVGYFIIHPSVIFKRE